MTTERAKELYDLAKWTFGGALAQQPRPDVDPATSREEDEIRKVWDDLGGSYCRADVLRFMAGEGVHYVRVTFSDGNCIRTTINGTKQEIESYYLGKQFNLGGAWDYDTEGMPVELEDNLQTAIAVEFAD